MNLDERDTFFSPSQGLGNNKWWTFFKFWIRFSSGVILSPLLPRGHLAMTRHSWLSLLGWTDTTVPYGQCPGTLLNVLQVLGTAPTPPMTKGCEALNGGSEGAEKLCWTCRFICWSLPCIHFYFVNSEVKWLLVLVILLCVLYLALVPWPRPGQALALGRPKSRQLTTALNCVLVVTVKGNEELTWQ